MKPDLLKRMMLFLFLITTCFALTSLTAQAQETITFKWQGSDTPKAITITATYGETYTIDWGNGEGPQNATGTGSEQTKSITYASPDDEYTVTIRADNENCLFTSLDISNRMLQELTISGAPSLERLNLHGNELKRLDISNLTGLETLDCNWNKLAELVVSENNTALTSIDCANNELIRLEIYDLPGLETLNCCFNKLRELEISNLTGLKTLYCNENELTTLEISTLTGLKELYCNENELTTLEISTLTGLKELYCDGNELRELNVSSLSSLISLVCGRNELTELDVSSLSSLIAVDCSDNKITSLTVNGANALRYLVCSTNALSTLDISENTALEYIDLQSNMFPISTINELIASGPDATLVGTQNIGYTDAPVVATPNSPIELDPACSANPGNYTYQVLINTEPPENTVEDVDYTIEHGKIIFLKKNTYKVTVTENISSASFIFYYDTRTSSVAKLTGLSVEGYTLIQPFDPQTLTYTLTIENNITSVNIVATANPGATIEGNGTITPPVGETEYKIKVTSQDGTTSVTYTIIITRKATTEEHLSSDAKLTSLWLSDGATLTPAFKPSIKNYTVTVGTETEEIEIDATANDLNASVAGTGVKRLLAGENLFLIRVTAENGSWDSYSLTITRGANPVGIETIDSNTITIYPNPITDYFRINGITQPAVISIYNLQGTALLQRKVEPNEQVFVGNLASGIYLIKVDGKTYKVLKK